MGLWGQGSGLGAGGWGSGRGRAAYARGLRFFLGRGLGCLEARHRWRSACRNEAVFLLHSLYRIAPSYANRGLEEYVLYGKSNSVTIFEMCVFDV